MKPLQQSEGKLNQLNVRSFEIKGVTAKRPDQDEVLTVGAYFEDVIEDIFSRMDQLKTKTTNKNMKSTAFQDLMKIIKDYGIKVNL